MRYIIVNSLKLTQLVICGEERKRESKFLRLPSVK